MVPFKKAINEKSDNDKALDWWEDDITVEVANYLARKYYGEVHISIADIEVIWMEEVKNFKPLRTK